MQQPGLPYGRERHARAEQHHIRARIWSSYRLMYGYKSIAY